MTTRAPDAVSIRPAERADLLAVYRIEQASFPQPWPFHAFEGFLDRPGFLVAVDEPTIGEPATGDSGGGRGPAGRGGIADGAGEAAEGGGEVLGYVVADVETEFGRKTGHVKDLAVAPDWRGRGIGTRLLERALSMLVAGGARRAKLEVRVDNDAARSLYAEFGFATKQVVPGYYEDGQDALLLVADLTDRA